MTIGRTLGIAALVALAPLAANAQTRISPDVFLDAVQGKTVMFYDFPSGILVGTEQFLSRDLSVWRMEGRGCVYGQITTPNGQLCFLYDDDPDGVPVCWWTFEYEGRLMVRLASFNHTEIQEVRNISEDDLNCPSAQIG
ncbi:hypothetical protein [Ruegeria profundi]|uniref:hypothetical protein n=1 Tax=Ruegeria profundi TaxID=1685378 RepID=UPI001CD6B755|nr:hypothetical protein [Ruegeria profundi]MCA0928943.1 hypothetical protein [Ruegeria profundi]